MEHFVPADARQRHPKEQLHPLGLPTLLLIGLLSQLGLTSEARAGDEAPNCGSGIRREGQPPNPPQRHSSRTYIIPIPELPISAPKYPEFWDREQKTRFQWDSRISTTPLPKK